MALGLGVYLDVVIIALAVVALFLALRLRTLFAHGAAGRPLMLLALSPVLIGVGEAFHVTSEVQENATLDLLHSIFETAFFVAISVAALLFVRVWSQKGTLTLGRPPEHTATEPEMLAAIVNRLAGHLRNITGPAFATGFFRRSVEEVLAGRADPSVREKLLLRLDPDIRPPT
jgi:hypothetical protein